MGAAHTLIKQTRVTADIVRTFRAAAALTDTTMKALHAAAIQGFLVQRKSLHEAGCRVNFYVVPNLDDAREINVELPSALMKAAVAAAKQEHVSVRCLLYTALVQHADAALEKLIREELPRSS